jgi:hypothetical protein
MAVEDVSARCRLGLAARALDHERETNLARVLSKLARAWGGVRPHRGITVIPTCGAAPAPVMPQVRRTWGRAESRENPQVRPSPLDLLGFWQPFQPRIATKTCRLYKRSREIIA